MQATIEIRHIQAILDELRQVAEGNLAMAEANNDMAGELMCAAQIYMLGQVWKKVMEGMEE